MDTNEARVVDGHTIVERGEDLVELTLYDDDTVSLNAQSGEDAADVRLTLDELRRLVEAAGHLLWTAREREA